MTASASCVRVKREQEKGDENAAAHCRGKVKDPGRGLRAMLQFDAPRETKCELRSNLRSLPELWFLSRGGALFRRGLVDGGGQ